MGAKRLEFNIEEVIRYILENKTTLRDAEKKFGISKSVIIKRIKEYDGLLKEDIYIHLKTNQYMSRKMCGTYHWKAIKEKNV